MLAPEAWRAVQAAGGAVVDVVLIAGAAAIAPGDGACAPIRVRRAGCAAGLEGVSGTGRRRACAAFGNVTRTRRGPADGGCRPEGVRRAGRRTTGAAFGNIAGTGRSAADGGGRRKGVGRAGGAGAGAGLRHVAGARRSAADGGGGREGVRRAGG